MIAIVRRNDHCYWSIYVIGIVVLLTATFLVVGPTDISVLRAPRMLVSTDNVVNETTFPRVIELSHAKVNTSSGRRKYELPEVINKAGIPGHYRRPQEKCKVVQKWQEQMYPSCNTVHESDFFRGIQNFGDDEYPVQTEYQGAGGTRDVWRIDVAEFNNTQSFAFKTLRFLKDYIWTRIDHQRIDATVSEHLTASQYIIDIYGYCGTATINEFGDQGTLGKYIQSNNSTTPLQRLRYARDVAYGTADVHEVDGYPTTTVQHDVKLPNVLLTNGNVAKIADFNNAHFLTMDGDHRCAFHFSTACRAMNITPPAEECSRKGLSTEKIEVFQLGFIFHFLLSPHDYQTKLQNPPVFPASVASSNDPATVALRAAMEVAFTVAERKRPSARVIADFLAQEVSKIETEDRKVDERRKWINCFGTVSYLLYIICFFWVCRHFLRHSSCKCTSRSTSDNKAFSPVGTISTSHKW